MDLTEVRKTAREKLKNYCRVCPVCDGRVCAGEVPGMGGVGSGQSFKSNVESLARIRFNLRTLHEAAVPSTEVRLFGRSLASPILGAPMTGSTYNLGGAISEVELARAIVAGCVQAGVIGMTGDGADPTMYDSGLDAIAESGGQGVAIVKPREAAEVRARVRRAEQAGVLAVGMDVDGAGLVTMALKGQPVGPKSPAELAEIISATPAPFVVKGVMTPDEAAVCAEAGAAAIVVSNHGGRVLDFCPGVAEVLPEVAAAVKGSGKGKVAVLADGGVRTGADVLKMLALGADAVLVGRPLAIAAVGGGAEGVALALNKMRSELAMAMLMTGTASAARVSPSILYAPSINVK